MGRRKNKESFRGELKEEKKREPMFHISTETKKSLHAVFFITLAIIITLSFFSSAGAFGKLVSELGFSWFGWGFYSLPIILIAMAGSLLLALHSPRSRGTLIAGGMLLLSLLGVMQLLHAGAGGGLGGIVASIEGWFGFWASLIILFSVLLSSVIIMFDIPLFVRKLKDEDEKDVIVAPVTGLVQTPVINTQDVQKLKETLEEKKEEEISLEDEIVLKKNPIKRIAPMKSEYVLPSLDMLEAESTKPVAGDIKVQANTIKRTLEHFGVPVEMGEVNIGSAVTRYAVKPAEGVKLSKIVNLHNDLALALAAHPIRIEAPIPGKSWVGIEVPNKACMVVRLRNLLEENAFQDSGLLAFAIGRDVTGGSVVANLAKMPHLLIAGATGSGKSVSIHAFMVSLLFKNTPDTLRLILIDPKRVELSIYNDVPHLIAPVITDGKRAIMSLKWAVQEMEHRYEKLLEVKARDIDTYNQKMASQKGEFMPFIVIVIDELADLMASFGKVVEAYIVRLAQMSRAVGIHLVVSTQRPSVDVITGLIKANIPSRMALQVVSQIDSRTILDTMGAEKLLGNGDMLYLAQDASKPKRLQGVYVSDDELKRLMQFWAKQKPESEGSSELEQTLSEEKSKDENTFPTTTSTFVDFDDMDGDSDGGDSDDLYDDALQVVKEAKKASASLLQRRLKVGYARAARLLDILEDKGIIGPGDGAKPREVYIDSISENEISLS